MRDWIGMRVRNKRDFHNGYGTSPKGTLFTITATGNGVEVTAVSDRISFSRVNPNDLEKVK
jgi:hypothetical protein